MTQKDNGGPAFPTGLTPSQYSQEGMTLRDWFAGQALVGLLAGSEVDATPAAWGEAAYLIADAMLAERSR